MLRFDRFEDVWAKFEHRGRTTFFLQERPTMTKVLPGLAARAAAACQWAGDKLSLNLNTEPGLCRISGIGLCQPEPPW